MEVFHGPNLDPESPFQALKLLPVHISSAVYTYMFQLRDPSQWFNHAMLESGSIHSSSSLVHQSRLWGPSAGHTPAGSGNPSVSAGCGACDSGHPNYRRSSQTVYGALRAIERPELWDEPTPHGPHWPQIVTTVFFLQPFGFPE